MGLPVIVRFIIIRSARFFSPRLPRQSSCRISVAVAVSRARISGLPNGVGSPSVRSSTPTRFPAAFSFRIAPAAPNSASSGCGAITSTSSFIRGKAPRRLSFRAIHRRSGLVLWQLGWTDFLKYRKSRLLRTLDASFRSSCRSHRNGERRVSDQEQRESNYENVSAIGHRPTLAS